MNHHTIFFCFNFINIPSNFNFSGSNADLEFSIEDPGYCNNSQNDHACGECVDSKVWIWVLKFEVSIGKKSKPLTNIAVIKIAIERPIKPLSALNMMRLSFLPSLS